MKRSTLLSLAGFAGLFATPMVRAQTVNFHAANNGVLPGYNQLYTGQGAYSDPGNNVWNGFTAATYAGGGPASTLFFGGNNPYPASGGSPGNPYAAYGANGTVSSSGPTVWGQGGTIDASGNATGVAAGNATSAGALSPIVLRMNYGFDNGGPSLSNQGTPKFILYEAAVVNNGVTGTFELDNVPTGAYTLYLYGANKGNNRGAAFTVSSGAAINGLGGTTNNPAHSAGNFVFGENYIVYTNVVPDVNGVISGTWGSVTNPISHNAGEGDFNGIQLVSGYHPPINPSLAFTSGVKVKVDWAPVEGILQSAPSVTGPWTSLPAATSPYTVFLTTSAQYYRVLTKP
ncbi:MAG: hypothetical protein JWR69_3417 [Pedosphaera sp.]|nr:hypothetical protein [Pedosphaera sp.]